MDMSYVNLIRVRDSLGLSISEAARKIGKTTPERWLRWESNSEIIPKPIVIKIISILAFYKQVCLIVSVDYSRKKDVNQTILKLLNRPNSETGDPDLDRIVITSAFKSVHASLHGRYLFEFP